MASPLEQVVRPWYDTSLGQGFTLPQGGSHDGRDIQTPMHTPLTNLLPGVVTPHTGFYPWGGEVDILTPSGITETFAHLDAIAVRPGQQVGTGGFIGLSGGENLPRQYSTGPHTHFSLFAGAPWDNSKAIDPTGLLQAFQGGGPDIPSLINGGLIGAQPTAQQAANSPGTQITSSVTNGATTLVNVTVRSALDTLLGGLPGVQGANDFLWRAGLITLGVALIIVGVLVTIWPAARSTGQAATQATVAAAKVAA